MKKNVSKALLVLLVAILSITFAYSNKNLSKEEVSKLKPDELKNAAEHGNPDAQLNLGNNYDIGINVVKDSSEAIKWWLKSAEQGNADAQLRLGLAYDIGAVIAKDLSESVKWYRKSAEHGNADAQYLLGLALAVGKGIEKNLREAVIWYRKAAEQGNADAQFILGLVNVDGEGTTKDFVEAYKWLNLASLNNPKALEIRNDLEKILTPQQREEGQRLAREWQEKHKY